MYWTLYNAIKLLWRCFYFYIEIITDLMNDFDLVFLCDSCYSTITNSTITSATSSEYSGKILSIIKRL